MAKVFNFAKEIKFSQMLQLIKEQRILNGWETWV